MQSEAPLRFLRCLLNYKDVMDVMWMAWLSFRESRALLATVDEGKGRSPPKSTGSDMNRIKLKNVSMRSELNI
eukprot:scaffold8740_cov113-Cylindrotheca_fusiformis.AAC.2